MYIYEKNSFVKVSKNLAGYRSEKKFVWTIKIITEHSRMSKSFALFVSCIST